VRLLDCTIAQRLDNQAVDDRVVPSEKAKVVDSRRQGPDGHGPLTRREWNAGVTITQAEYRRRAALLR
jgi:hypothetical protein